MTSLEGLQEDFRDLIRLLIDAGADFVIVGAHALALHGAPRASGDIDLFVRPDPQNAERVFERRTESRQRIDVAKVTAEEFSRPGMCTRSVCRHGGSTS